MQREGWLLEIPAYAGGSLSEEAYNIGGGLDLSLASESGRMQVIRQTNGQEFEAYGTLLQAEGYAQVFANACGANRFAQFQKGRSLIYAYYIEAWRETRVIAEREGNTVAEFSDALAVPQAPLALYQYAMMYNRNGNGNQKGDPYGNCGMFYLLRLADNSLVLMDGGDPRQVTDRSTAALMDFMREITHTPAGEKVRIAAIFISHPHHDHLMFLVKLVEQYADQLEIHRAMHNLPVGVSPTFRAFGSRLRETYPNAKFLKLHTGEKFWLGGALIEVVAAHEDLVDAVTGKTIVTESNNTSTPLKLTLNGRTFMMLTDWGGGDTRAPAEYAVLEPRFLAEYQSENGAYDFLHCDVLQVTHHALNPYMGKINAAIAPAYALFPAADVALASQAHPNVVNVNYDQLIAAGTDPDHMYFASRYTYCFHVATDGTITVAAEDIRGADLEDDPNTPNLDRHGVPQEHLKEQDYVHVTLAAYPPYRIPTEEERSRWGQLHR